MHFVILRTTRHSAWRAPSSRSPIPSSGLAPEAPEGLEDGGDSDREGDTASTTPGTRQQRAARCRVARWRRRLRNGRQGVEGPILGDLGHHGATGGPRSHRAPRGAQHSPRVSPGCPLSPQAPVQGHHRARAALPPGEKQPVVKGTPWGWDVHPGASRRRMRTCGATPAMIPWSAWSH